MSSLERWAPGHKPDRVYHAERSALHVADVHDSPSCHPYETTAQSPSTLSDTPRTPPQLTDAFYGLSELRRHNLDSSRSELPVSIQSTSYESSCLRSNASLEIDLTEHGSQTVHSFTNRDWKQHKPTLEHLYMVENKPLAEVRSFMAEQYKFSPT